MSYHSVPITEQDKDDHGVLAGTLWICEAEKNGFFSCYPYFITPEKFY